MSTSPEPDFKQLKRLLALKRHEQPPPGYFDFLARRVQEEIRATRPSRRRPDPSGNLLHQFFGLLETLQTRPAFAVGVGAVVCTLLVGGVVFFEQPDQTVQPTPSLLTEVAPQPFADSATQPVALEMSPMLASNAPAGGAPNLFDLLQPPTAMPAGFTNW